MLLTEIFSKPAPVQQVGKYEYKFDVDDTTYYIQFKPTPIPAEFTDDQQGGDAVEVSFFSLDQNERAQFKLTGGGNAFKVMATVIAAISKWVSQHNPDYVIFSADKGETSRVKMYARLLKSYNIQYQVHNPEQDQDHVSSEDLLFIVPTNQFT